MTNPFQYILDAIPSGIQVGMGLRRHKHLPKCDLPRYEATFGYAYGDHFGATEETSKVITSIQVTCAKPSRAYADTILVGDEPFEPNKAYLNTIWVDEEPYDRERFFNNFLPNSLILKPKILNQLKQLNPRLQPKAKVRTRDKYTLYSIKAIRFIQDSGEHLKGFVDLSLSKVSSSTITLGEFSQNWIFPEDLKSRFARICEG